MTGIDRVITWVSGLFAVLASMATVVLMLALTADVTARAVTGGSLPGMVELSETSLVVIVSFGLAYAGVNGAHIAMTMVTAKVPPRVASLMRLIGWALSAALLVWLTYATGARAVTSTATGEHKFGLLEWPLWPGRWALAVGLGLMTVVAFLQCARQVAALRQGGAASGASSPGPSIDGLGGAADVL